VPRSEDNERRITEPARGTKAAPPGQTEWPGGTEEEGAA